MTTRPTRILLGILSLVILTSAPGAAMAQEADAYDAWIAVLDALSPESNRDDAGEGTPLISADDLAIVANLGYDFGRIPTAEERAALERISALVPLLEDATTARSFTRPDGTDDGWLTPLPHLSTMRAATRTMTALANRDFADGDVDGALGWIGRTMHAAGQASQDDFFVSSLVGAAIMKSGGDSMDWLIGRGVMDREMAAAWLERYDWSVDRVDPFNLAGATATEHLMTLEELDRLADALDRGDDPDRLELFESMLVDGVPEDLTAETLRAEMSVLDEYFAEIESAIADPDRGRGLDTLKEIDAELETLDPPLLTLSMLPDAVTLLEVVIGLEREMDDRLRLLEGLASGRLRPKDVTNPATLWLELGTRFEELPANVQLAGLEILGLTPIRPRLIYRLRDSTVALDVEALLEGTPDDDTPESIWLEGLAGIGPRLTTLALDAAAIDPKEFTAKHESSGPAILDTGLERFRAAGLGLLADATAHLAMAMVEDDSVEFAASLETGLAQQVVVDDLVSTIGLARGLLADRGLSHLLIASELLRRVADLLATEAATRLWADDVHRDRLMGAITAIPREPALGIAAARRADLDRLIDARIAPPERRSDLDRAVARLDSISADAIYHIATATNDARVTTVDRWFDPTLSEETIQRRTTPPEMLPDEGYRPLRLLASLDELLGPGLILVEDPDASSAFRAARERWYISATAGRDALTRLQGSIPAAIGLRGSESLNQVADLDRRASTARRLTR